MGQKLTMTTPRIDSAPCGREVWIPSSSHRGQLLRSIQSLHNVSLKTFRSPRGLPYCMGALKPVMQIVASGASAVTLVRRMVTVAPSARSRGSATPD
ncbi:hypothetical protein BV20DRAFT_326070 [Pilatotrama ljubarskyi]|nr:hypothetical protein BV20DRAFT_326070 [Pilatotrama ljubarskyi]